MRKEARKESIETLNKAEAAGKPLSAFCWLLLLAGCHSLRRGHATCTQASH